MLRRLTPVHSHQHWCPNGQDRYALQNERLEAYKRGSHTDEMWVDYIKNQTPPEPDDNFNVT